MVTATLMDAQMDTGKDRRADGHTVPCVLHGGQIDANQMPVCANKSSLLFKKKDNFMLKMFSQFLRFRIVLMVSHCPWPQTVFSIVKTQTQPTTQFNRV